MTGLLVGSLFLILWAAALAGLSWGWRAAGGALLLVLWLLTLLRKEHGGRLARLLPGHALLFFAVGRSGTAMGLYFWCSAMVLTLALASQRTGARVLWAILWPVLMGAIQQVGATKLTGPMLWAWTGGLAALALALTIKEVRTILRAQRGEP